MHPFQLLERLIALRPPSQCAVPLPHDVQSCGQGHAENLQLVRRCRLSLSMRGCCQKLSNFRQARLQLHQCALDLPK